MADTSETPRRIPLWERVRIRFRRTPAAEAPLAAEAAPRRRALRLLLIAIPVVLVLWYPVGMLLTSDIRDDLDFGTTDLVVPPNGSRAVAIAAALIGREVDQGPWVANDPF